MLLLNTAMEMRSTIGASRYLKSIVQQLFIGENMAKVIILCGKIASGKSFYANRLKENSKAVILSVDDLMLKLSDSCLGDRHDDVALRCENYFYGLAEQMIAIGLDVIIDFGYWSRKEREAAREYFKTAGIPFQLHYINTPDERRKIQLEERNKRLLSSDQEHKGRVYIIGEELLNRLDLKFEDPLPDEIDELIEFQ